MSDRQPLYLAAFVRAVATGLIGVLPGWLRLLGAVAALLFGATAMRLFAGAPVLPTSSPLPFFAYPFLVANLLGWAWTLCRTR